MQIVIVGGVAAGVTAATRLRRLMEDAKIILIERGEKISFANCALPYYAGGLLKPEGLYAAQAGVVSARNAVDIRERHEVLSIDREAKKLSVKNLVTGEVYALDYDKLILATGADPRMLPIEGLKENAHPLWRTEDAIRLEEALSKNPELTAAIVGGGAVGLEAAENIVRRGGTVHLLEYGRTIMGRNDAALSDAFVHLAEGKNRRLVWHLGRSASKIERLDSGRLSVTLTDGSRIEVDYLLSAAGVQPRSKLAEAAGLELGPRGTILCDGMMRTSDPDIFAAGDVATSPDPETGAPRPMMLAGTAVKEGRKAADAIAGLAASKPLKGGFGTNAVSLFGTLWASTGKNEQTLMNEGKKRRRDFFTATLIGSNHVGWYPGSVPLLLKIVFDPEGRLLGAQAIGRDGADKRVDVLSTAMRFGANVRDLPDFDLCYSPQTGAPKDPVNTAGHLAENILNGLVRFIEPQEVANIFADLAPDLGDDVPNTPDRTYVLDVRTPPEVADDPIPVPFDAIPLEELRERLDEIPRDGRTIVVVCRAAVRAYTAARLLDQKGFANVFVMTGGMRYWNLVRPNLKGE